MNEKDYDEQLQKAGDFHGEICGGIAIGTKLAMYGPLTALPVLSFINRIISYSLDRKSVV